MTLNATSTSTDPEGGGPPYSWVLDGKESTDGDQGTESFTYGLPGTYGVTLIVTHVGGLTSAVIESATVAAAAGGDEPTVTEEPLHETAADVQELAALGGLVLVGGSGGAFLSRLRSSGAHAV